MKEKRNKILVTGGAGYIGSSLVPVLLAHGYDVRVFDSLVFGGEALSSVRGQIELIKGDVRTPPPEIMDGIYGIIHLAGLSTEATSYYNPRYTDQVNHLGTEIVAAMAKARGIERFVFASSCSVYFTYDTPLVPPFYTEESKINTISPYSISKRAAELALLELTDAHFQPTILRKGTIYGFSPRMRYDLVVNSFTKDAFNKKRITVHAGGEIYRPLLDIQDAIATYIAALELPREAVGGKIFNVLYSNTRIGDLAKKFQEVIRTKKGVEINADIQQVGAARNYRADNTRFVSTFNLKPLRTVEDAILEIWGQLENGHDSANPKYYNDHWQIEAMKSHGTFI